MMALAHDAKRVTADVDSHIRRGRDAVTRAVAEIADEEGLSRYWLNEAVTMRYLPEDPDRATGRSTPTRTCCGRPASRHGGRPQGCTS